MEKRNRWLPIERGRRRVVMMIQCGGLGDFVGLDGSLDQAIVPGTLPLGGQKRPSSSGSNRDAIRPTRDSDESEIAHYFRVVTGICEHALGELVQRGVFKEEEYVRIAPVDGCFLGRPPEPHVTLSEVIAVVLDSKILQRWEKARRIDFYLRQITSAIQSVSYETRCNRSFKTYVIIYISQVNMPLSTSEPRNSLISIDFDLERSSSNQEKEEAERNHLLEELGVIFSAETLRSALTHGTKVGDSAFPVSSRSTMPMTDAMKVGRFGLTIMICGWISAILFVFSLMALLPGFLFGTLPPWAGVLGIGSGLFLMFSGAFSEELLRISGE